MFRDIIDSFSNKGFVFLGGTCNGSKWRDKIIPKLEIDYFNPVVDEWTPEAQKTEIEKRSQAKYLLYVITPAMTGVYSIAEVVDDSNKRPDKTIFCFLTEDIVDDKEYKFTDHQIKSLNMVGEMVQRNGGVWLKSLDEVVNYLNSTKGMVQDE